MVERKKIKAGQSGSKDTNPFFRSLRLEIRLSPNELDRIQQNKQSGGFGNLSQFVRAQALAPKGVQSPNALRQAVLSCSYQLNKIGVNINQIARHLNQGIPADEEIRLVLMQIQEHAQALVDQAKARGDQ
jgi:CHASE3 domain sensor protein